MAETDRLAEELEGILPGRVIKDVSGYLRDWWPLIALDESTQGQAIAAVKPINLDEVVTLVNFASEKQVPLFLRGGGSSVTGASIPSGGIVIDMSALNQVLDIDDTNRTVTLQAGVRLKDAESKVNARGFTLSQVPQSFELATVGGYVSTMGTGQFSSLYGGVEEAVLRLEVVLPTGEVIWTKKRDSPRSSMGPELSKLFIGAEGSFGIVVAAELKIRRLPKHIWKVAYSFSSFDAAINTSKLLMDLDIKPAICRAYNEMESMFQFREESCIMLLVYHFESESVFALIKGQVSNLLLQVSKAADPALVDKWLERRFNFKEEMEGIQKMSLTIETIEVAAKWSRLYELYLEAIRSLGQTNGVSGIGAHLSHLYDQGACIYFTVLFEPKKEVYWNVWKAMASISKNHDATLSHHHGVGILKKVYAKSEVPIILLERIKEAIDPEGIFNPGRLV